MPGVSLKNTKNIAGEGERDKSIDISNFYYVAEPDRIFNRNTHGILTRPAFNVLKKPFFKNAVEAIVTERAESVVDNFTWLPNNPNVVNDGQRRLVNTYRPPDCLGKSGDTEPWEELLYYLVPKDLDRQHLLNWMAFTAQKPEIKINHQIFFGGPMRIGKDSIFQPLIRAVGAHNVSQPSNDALHSQFTEFLYSKKLVIVQECMNFERRDIENRLKPICASPPDELLIDLKGVRQFNVPNLVSLIFMSNHADGLHLSEGDGRYFCIWCDCKPLSEAFYKNYYDWLHAGGIDAVVYFLKNRDISDFNPGAVSPETEFKKSMIGYSVDGVVSKIKTLIEEREPPFCGDIVTAKFVADELRLKNYKIAALKLRDAGCVNMDKFETKVSGKRKSYRCWSIRNHVDCAKMTDSEKYSELEKHQRHFSPD